MLIVNISHNIIISISFTNTTKLSVYETFQGNQLLRRNKNKNPMVKKILHKNSWCAVTVQIHVDPHLTPLIKIKFDPKTERDYVKIKFLRKSISEKLDMYALKTIFLTM